MKQFLGSEASVTLPAGEPAGSVTVEVVGDLIDEAKYPAEHRKVRGPQRQPRSGGSG